MISDTRAEKALRYLAETDELCAEAKAGMERAEYKYKAMRETVFKMSTGTVAERTAEAMTHEKTSAAHEEYALAIRDYNHIANKRATEIVVIDCWRTIQSNRRAGNV
jgi:hypothetical protein